jgi:hypothetical protein
LLKQRDTAVAFKKFCAQTTGEAVLWTFRDFPTENPVSAVSTKGRSGAIFVRIGFSFGPRLLEIRAKKNVNLQIEKSNIQLKYYEKNHAENPPSSRSFETRRLASVNHAGRGAPSVHRPSLRFVRQSGRG